MDWLIRGGTVVSMAAGSDAVRGDVWIRNGRIVATGAVAPTGTCRVIDAEGCAVIPGLVQAHVHLCQALFRGMADDRPLLPWLRDRIWPLEAAHDPASLDASARLGLAEMLLGGTTCILDMGTVRHHEAVMEALLASGMRGLSGKAMMDAGVDVPVALRESTRASVDESVALHGRYHGAGDGRVGYAFAPRFILSCTRELLEATASTAAERGAIVHTHAAEHADERAAVREALLCDDIAALARAGISGTRAVLAHGVQLRADEMAELARAGTRLVHCPSANLKLASGIADVAAMRRAGIVVGLGSDGAPCNNRMDAWTELRQAAILAKAKHGDAAALPAREALELATSEGARVLGLDAEIGTLEPGKRADVVIVRVDDLHCEPGGDVVSRLVYSCTARDVRHVMVNGELLVQAGVLTRWDASEVVARAREQARAVLARADLR